MNKILFSFPGQGNQFSGILDRIPQRAYYQELCISVLGKSLEEISTDEALLTNDNVQACLYICGISWAREFIRSSVKPNFAAGLSIGAFPAAVICDSLPIEEGLKMVFRRGYLMQQAYPRGYGLTAIIGLNLNTVEALCQETSEVYIANYNAEDQIVIAGEESKMAEVSQKAQDKGATRCVRIKITVPSHCPLLSEAAEMFSKEFSSVCFKRPKVAYISGSTGRAIWDAEKIKDDLIFNMCRRTQWHEAMVAASQRGANIAIEMPPGETLTNLTKKAFSTGLCVSADRLPIKEIADQISLRGEFS